MRCNPSTQSCSRCDFHQMALEGGPLYVCRRAAAVYHAYGKKAGDWIAKPDMRNHCGYFEHGNRANTDWYKEGFDNAEDFIEENPAFKGDFEALYQEALFNHQRRGRFIPEAAVESREFKRGVLRALELHRRTRKNPVAWKFPSVPRLEFKHKGKVLDSFLRWKKRYEPVQHLKQLARYMEGLSEGVDVVPTFKPLTLKGYLARNIDPLTYGNFKLSNKIAIFDLPAGGPDRGGTCRQTCPGCYAVQAEEGVHGADVTNRRTMNLWMTKQSWFPEAILESIRRAMKNRDMIAVRVHSAGDFYSQEYVNKWVAVAKAAKILFPRLKFYAYTKSARCFNLSGLSKVGNFVVIDSMKYGVINFGEQDYLNKLKKRFGAFQCPCDKADREYTKADFEKMTKEQREKLKICGTKCVYCQNQRAFLKPPVFLQHGKGRK